MKKRPFDVYLMCPVKVWKGILAEDEGKALAQIERRKDALLLVETCDGPSFFHVAAQEPNGGDDDADSTA
jgi:hypothetical protein